VGNALGEPMWLAAGRSVTFAGEVFMPGMIVAPQPLAVEEGAKVLAAGGNAFDAAVTAAVVQGVIDPHSCGVGGYLVMTYHRAGQRSPSPILDAPAIAGSLVKPDQWKDAILRPNPDGWGYFLKDKVNDVGYQSICVPGMVRGLAEIQRRFCTRSWSGLLQPGIRVADEGWPVSSGKAASWKEPAAQPESATLRDKLHATTETKRVWLKADGSTYEAGEKFRHPDYARTLRRLAERGPEDFYSGELAREIAGDLQKHGAWVTAGDLASYKSREAAPTVINYRGFQIVTNQSPHGGPTLAQALKILEADDLCSLGHNSAKYLLRVSLAMKAAFADRNRLMGDPDFEPDRVHWMLSPERVAEWRRVIESGQRFDVPRGPTESRNTTQVTVTDRFGNWVSLTHSLGSSSGVISPGLGFMYNNSMVNFDPLPGGPNQIAPQKGRTTGMAPTLVYQNGLPVLALGAPGATRIITAVLQVVLNVLDFGMSVSDAVLAPRFDCQGDIIKCQARIPELVCSEVRRAHAIERASKSHGGFALVHAISCDPRTCRLTGAADTGGEGMPLLVD
jgi:gamma-glutamyltranspeptidase/glutathione hydrolase